VLVKPQFEVGRGQVGRGGIVRDDKQRQAATDKVIACAAGLGLSSFGVLDSPVVGQKGNREVLVALRRSTGEDGRSAIERLRRSGGRRGA
jgi:23S rRNA (cytidine1920-2'-O)/16S rRNA (cytidine1409-2'-O)-methyltransferase